MPNNLLRMVRGVIETRKNHTKAEKILVTEQLNIYDDMIKKGEIGDVSPHTCEQFLKEWARVVQTFEGVLDFVTCFVENAVLFFKGLKRLRRRSLTRKQSEYYFSWGGINE